ncbi:MAG: GNAT family N-acetyltransferase [Flavobacteriales bacterium]
MNLKEVNIGEELYIQGVQIRRDYLFNGIENPNQYLQDPWEKRSIHVVVERDALVLGVGRLTYDEDGNGIVSQMAVKPQFRGKNVGCMILEHLVKLCVFNSSEKIYMSARESAIGFYEKLGFNTIGAKFASPKTGIVHVSMVLGL